MNFITVENGLLNLDSIVYIDKEMNTIALINGDTLDVSSQEIDKIYDAMVRYITKERVKELKSMQEEPDGTG